MGVRTLGNIKSVLSYLLDDENTGSTDFYPEATRELAINAAYEELFNEAQELAGGKGPVLSTATLTVTSGQDTIASADGWPDDLQQIVHLYWKESETNSFPWEEIRPDEMHEYRSRISRSNRQLAYYLNSWSAGITLVPTPTFSDSTKLTLIYVAAPITMSDDSDEPVFPKTHRELIAYEAFVRLKEKEGVDPSATAIQKRLELRHRFESDMRKLSAQSADRLAGPANYDIYSPVAY